MASLFIERRITVCYKGRVKLFYVKKMTTLKKVLAISIAGPAVALMISSLAFAQMTPTPSVTVNDGNFSPQTITVPVGATVNWTNSTQGNHTVTADNGLFDSGPLAPNATFSYTFNTAGTYAYYCKNDGGPGGQGMSGTVIVSNENNQSPDYSNNNYQDQSQDQPPQMQQQQQDQYMPYQEQMRFRYLMRLFMQWLMQNYPNLNYNQGYNQNYNY